MTGERIKNKKTTNQTNRRARNRTRNCSLDITLIFLCEKKKEKIKLNRIFQLDHDLWWQNTCRMLLKKWYTSQLHKLYTSLIEVLFACKHKTDWHRQCLKHIPFFSRFQFYAALFICLKLPNVPHFSHWTQNEICFEGVWGFGSNELNYYLNQIAAQNYPRFSNGQISGFLLSENRKVEEFQQCCF